MGKYVQVSIKMVKYHPYQEGHHDRSMLMLLLVVLELPRAAPLEPSNQTNRQFKLTVFPLSRFLRINYLLMVVLHLIFVS